MPYTNPGELFIDERGFKQSEEGVREYVNFLLEESGAANTLPVDLDYIYRHFQMEKPIRKPIGDVRGFLVSGAYGQIVINENDRPSRQRFTEAHELIEYVFKALKERQSWDGMRVGDLRHGVKENLCDLGAAELLMPQKLFTKHVNGREVSFETARDLAAIFNVSLTASLVRLIELSNQPYAVVLFRKKHKPSELKDLEHATVQLGLFNEAAFVPPEPQLRVQWSISRDRSIFVPKDKSVGEETSIYEAWRDGTFKSGIDDLDLGRQAGHFRCTSLPFSENNERFVLSLISFA